MPTLELWRHGPPPQPVACVGQFAREMEANGWHGLAVPEDHGLVPDPYVVLAAAAASTTTLKVGTGCGVPLRPALLHSSALASLHALSGGRELCSFGRGDLAMRLAGVPPISLRDFVTYMANLRTYLAAGDVLVGDTSTRLSSAFDADPSLGRGDLKMDVSVSGPKGVAAAAIHADSLTFAVGNDPSALRERIALARRIREEAALDPSTLRFGCYVPAAVIVDGNRQAARDIIRLGVTTHARFTTTEPGAGETEDDLVDRFAIVAEPDHFVNQLNELADIGIDRVLLMTRVPSTDHEEQNFRAITDEVIPRFLAS